jgi:hypothetical protein
MLLNNKFNVICVTVLWISSCLVSNNNKVVVTALGLVRDSFTPLSYVNFNDSTTDKTDDLYPAIACTSKICISVWEHWNDSLSRGDIRGSRISVNSLRSGQGQIQWLPPQRIVAIGQNYYPNIKCTSSSCVVVCGTTNGINLSSDFDVIFTVTLDNGETWATPQLLNSDGLTDGIRSDDSVVLATDGNLTYIAAWVTNSAPPGSGDTSLRVVRSVDGGITFSSAWLVIDSGSGFLIGQASVLYHASGKFILSWSSKLGSFGNGNDRDLFYATSTNYGLNWTTPVLLNSDAMIDDATSDDENCHFITNQHGAISAIWNAKNKDGISAYILRIRNSFDAGVTWSTTRSLDAMNDGELIFSGTTGSAVASDGHIFMMITRRGNVNSMTMRTSVDFGESWSSPSNILGKAGYIAITSFGW